MKWLSTFAVLLSMIVCSGCANYGAFDMVRADWSESALLGQNYPYKFNSQTWIRFELAESTPVTLRVFDVMSREIHALMIGVYSAGIHEVAFNAESFPSGAYYRLDTPTGSFTRTMLLHK